MWLLEGAVEAVIITLFCFYILGEMSLSSLGINSDFWLVGLTMYPISDTVIPQSFW